MIRVIATVLLVLGLGAAAAAPALADDASLKAAVEQQQRATKPALTGFAKAVDRFGDARDRASARSLRAATVRLSRALGRYAAGVRPEQASSAPFGRARTALLSALKQFRGGLGTYATAITQLLNGSSEQTVKRTLRSATRRLAAAQKTLEDAEGVLVGT